MSQATGVSIQLHPPYMSPQVPICSKTRPDPERQEPEIPRLQIISRLAINHQSDKMMHGLSDGVGSTCLF
jgi:hypothetical protein